MFKQLHNIIIILTVTDHDTHSYVIIVSSNLILLRSQKLQRPTAINVIIKLVMYKCRQSHSLQFVTFM